MTVFRGQIIATAGPQADAALLAGIAANTDPEREIIAVPLADSRNQFTEDPSRNTGQVVGLEFDGRALIADVDIRDPDVARRYAAGLLGRLAAVVDKRSRKLRAAGISLRPPKSTSEALMLTDTDGGTMPDDITPDDITNAIAELSERTGLPEQQLHEAVVELSASGSVMDTAKAVAELAVHPLRAWPAKSMTSLAWPAP